MAKIQNHASIACLVALRISRFNSSGHRFKYSWNVAEDNLSNAHFMLLSDVKQSTCRRKNLSSVPFKLYDLKPPTNHIILMLYCRQRNTAGHTGSPKRSHVLSFFTWYFTNKELIYLNKMFPTWAKADLVIGFEICRNKINTYILLGNRITLTFIKLGSLSLYHHLMKSSSWIVSDQEINAEYWSRFCRFLIPKKIIA